MHTTKTYGKAPAKGNVNVLIWSLRFKGDQGAPFGVSRRKLSVALDTIEFETGIQDKLDRAIINKPAVTAVNFLKCFTPLVAQFCLEQLGIEEGESFGLDAVINNPFSRARFFVFIPFVFSSIV